MESPSRKWKVAWWGLIIVGCSSLSCAVGYQYLELRRLREELQGRTMASEAMRGVYEGEIQDALGYYLELLGGTKRNLLTYQFEGGVTVRFGRHWCAFDCEDSQDFEARRKLMETIAPKVIPGCWMVMPRIEEEWKSFSQSSASGGRLHQFTDSQTGNTIYVAFRFQDNASTIDIRWQDLGPASMPVATNDGGKGAVEIDDRLIGEWEHVFKKDEKYPAGDLFPAGTKVVIRFRGDGTLTSTTFSPDGKQARVERRWRVEYTFPNTKQSFALHRIDIEPQVPSSGSIWMPDVVHLVDHDRINIQGPADVQSFEYTRAVSSEGKARATDEK